MQPSIFGKQLEDVDYSDVVNFCKLLTEEGLGLDYKKDLSSLANIVKALVSFANTNGGWLIVGVEDKNDAPKLPVVGMSYEDNFEQKVNNSIVSSVTPIVIPYYKVCSSKDGKKAFLLIYVPQSQAAPHWMNHKKRNVLFIRVADRSTSDGWEQYATGSQWELLRERRQGSIDLRNQLVNVMKDVFRARAVAEDEIQKEIDQESNTTFLGMRNLTTMVPTHSFFEGHYYENALTISVLPAYPTEQVADVNTIEDAMTTEAVSNGLSSRYAQTPNHQGYDTKIYQSGAYVFHKDTNTGGYYFFGLDGYGGIMSVDPIERETEVENESGRKILTKFTEINWIVMDIVGTLQFAEKFYSKNGLLGNIVFRAEYSGTEGCLMYFQGVAGWHFNTQNLPANVTGSFLVQHEIDSNTLSNKTLRHKFIKQVVTEILHSFNYSAINGQILMDLIELADSRR